MTRWLNKDKTLFLLSFIAFGHATLGGIAIIIISGALLKFGNEPLNNLLQSIGLKLSHLHPGFLTGELLKMADVHLLFLLLLVIAYAGTHLTEGIGLWRRTRWGEWFCIIDAAVYIPFEIDSMHHQLTWLNCGALLFNVMLIIYMFFLLKTRKSSRRP